MAALYIKKTISMCDTDSWCNILNSLANETCLKRNEMLNSISCILALCIFTHIVSTFIS